MAIYTNGTATNMDDTAALDTDDLALVAQNGDGAPASTPTYIGQFYVDTTGFKLYFAKGISSSNDWVIAN